MSNRTLAILVAVFFAGLMALWLAPGSGPPGGGAPGPDAVPVLSSRVLASDSVEIEGDPAGPIALYRDPIGRWHCRGAGEASAGRVEAFLRSLSRLQAVPETGVLDGPPARYGLAPPRRVVRLSREGGRLAELHIGTGDAATAYVRAGDGGPIRVVAAPAVGPALGPASSWREPRLLPVQQALVRSLTIHRAGGTLQVDRDADGRWTLSRPVRAPGDPEAIGRLVAGLAALPAGEPVAVAAPARPEDEPWLRVEVEVRDGLPRRFAVGAEIPGRAGLYAARREDDPGPFALPLAPLEALLPKSAQDLRSRRALVFQPDRVRALAVVEGGREHLVVREPDDSWRLERPDRAPADAKVVNDLIQSLSELEAAAVLAPGAIPETGVDAPQATINLWLGEAGTGEVPESDEPGTLSLEVGRRDAGRKQAYVRTGGDTSILAVVDSFPASLPRGDLAFRDRNVQAIAPGRIARIAVEQGGQTDEVIAGERPGDYASWRMEKPLAARVDPKAVAALDLLLSRLRAASLVDTGPGAADPARFGLDRPVVRVTWTLRPVASEPAGGGTLRVGDAVGKADERRFAAIDGRPGVFTIDPKALAILTAELHERTVLTYPPEAVERLTLRWPGRPAWEVERKPRPFEGVDWVTRAGTGPSGLPVADLSPLAARLALLTTERFAQYDGPHRPEFGLDPPALSVEVTLSGNLGTRLLRIGARGPAGTRFAAAGTGDSGPVFYVPEEPWAPWLNPPEGEPAKPSPTPELPGRVFAPGG
jgi:hypothetical protein